MGRYGYRPLLAETPADGRRSAGICYRAANWILLGKTQGRGQMGRPNQADRAARKLIFVYPLCQNPQERLREGLRLRFAKAQAEPDWA